MTPNRWEIRRLRPFLSLSLFLFSNRWSICKLKEKVSPAQPHARTICLKSFSFFSLAELTIIPHLMSISSRRSVARRNKYLNVRLCVSFFFSSSSSLSLSLSFSVDFSFRLPGQISEDRCVRWWWRWREREKSSRITTATCALTHGLADRSSALEVFDKDKIHSPFSWQWLLFDFQLFARWCKRHKPTVVFLAKKFLMTTIGRNFHHGRTIERDQMKMNCSQHRWSNVSEKE